MWRGSKSLRVCSAVKWVSYTYLGMPLGSGLRLQSFRIRCQRRWKAVRWVEKIISLKLGSNHSINSTLSKRPAYFITFYHSNPYCLKIREIATSFFGGTVPMTTRFHSLVGIQYALISKKVVWRLGRFPLSIKFYQEGGYGGMGQKRRITGVE